MSMGRVLILINEMADYHSADISPEKMKMLFEDLDGYDINGLYESWKKYRLSDKGRFMPTAFDLINNIPDGRPTANEAFALLPRHEDESVVWTHEIQTAWFSVKNQMGNSPQAAWFAFKEKYDSLVLEARKNKQNAIWSVSLGFDVAGRDKALVEALDKKRISLEFARQHSPELEYRQENKPMLTQAEALKQLNMTPKEIAK